MTYQFTAAALRAIRSAAGWYGSVGSDELAAPALLLGLLAESECRAAIMLARYGIDKQGVFRRWPQLETDTPPDSCVPQAVGRFSSEIESSLAAVCARLEAYPRPLTLATEHLLLGLAAAGHQVSLWLRQQGMEPAALEAEIHRLYGHDPGPLALDPEITEGANPNHLPEGDGTWGTPLPAGKGTWDAPLPAGQGTCDVPVSAGKGTCDVPLLVGEETSHLASPSGRGAGGEGDLSVVDASQAEPTAPSLHPNPLPKGPRVAVLFPTERIGLLRAIDAAANRAAEGLRTIEDFVRFVLDDRHLTDRGKTLRHEVAAAVGRMCGADHRLSARETQADVGTTLTAPSESQRADLSSLVAANFSRLQESLRTLEEFSKLIDPAGAGSLKQLRYQSYTLHRAVQITRASQRRLAGATLYVLLDGRSSREEFQRLAETLIEVGIHIIQLRDKRLDDRRLVERARLLRELTQGTGTLLIVNDRPDLAALCRADGVHVGQEELSIKDARTLLGPDALIGVSTHSIQQARQAVLDGANYLGVGPTFPSGTKHFAALPGVDLLRAVAAEISLPAFAIGGITPENLPQVLSAGSTRIAVSGTVATAADPAAVTRRLLAMLSAP